MSSPADRAKDVLVALDMWKIPVDPFAIAKEEGIELAPGEYGENFDARIEFIPSVKKFVIYFRETGRTAGRIRFSIAHEIGHYYMPEHRECVLQGKLHNSQSDFRSRDPREQEADDFAASLLMPKELFVQEVHRHYNRVCTLRELCSMADKKFETSITSTARRYCQCDIEACALVMSMGGNVWWAMYSEDMAYRNMKYVKFGAPVPAGSKTDKLWGMIGEGCGETIEGSIETTIWFPYPKYHGRLWEEAMPLGNTGLVLTYMTLEDPDE